MKQILLLVVIGAMTAATQATHAQDWRTVRAGDTVYFMGGESVRYSCLQENNGFAHVFRVIVVDSVVALPSGDTALTFPKTLRSLNIQNCVDTSAASWQGTRCLQQASGADLFFNRRGDTVRIMTRAQPNDSWILTKDSAGTVFTGRLDATIVDTVDGTLDSIKVATIQAMYGGLPVSHPANGKVFSWSKHHGWIKTLDLFSFPYPLPTQPRFGAQQDAAEAIRIRDVFSSRAFLDIDLAWKYAPGNEWIGESTRGFFDYASHFQTVRHDSVLSFQLITPGSALVSLKTVLYSWTRGSSGPGGQSPPQISLTTVFHTDTVHSSTHSNVWTAPLLPEVKRKELAFYELENQFLYEGSYSILPMCDSTRYLIFQTSVGLGPPGYFNGCMQIASLGNGSFNSGIFTGFGQARECLYFMANGGPTDRYERSRLLYYKLGECTSGAKFNVESLSDKGSPRLTEGGVALYPNPASETTTLSNLPAGPTHLSLLDATGRLLFSTSTTEPQVSFSTAHLPSGIFFLRVRGKAEQRVLKLEVLH